MSAFKQLLSEPCLPQLLPQLFERYLEPVFGKMHNVGARRCCHTTRLFENHGGLVSMSGLVMQCAHVVKTHAGIYSAQVSIAIFLRLSISGYVRCVAYSLEAGKLHCLVCRILFFALQCHRARAHAVPCKSEGFGLPAFG